MGVSWGGPPNATRRTLPPAPRRQPPASPPGAPSPASFRRFLSRGWIEAVVRDRRTRDRLTLDGRAPHLAALERVTRPQRRL
jgi:hypothetical protein